MLRNGDGDADTKAHALSACSGGVLAMEKLGVIVTTTPVP
jgi:hypothetical protein